MGNGSLNKRIESSKINGLITNGQMAEVIRTLDWSKTGLGPCDQWPAALRLSVNAMLSTHVPTAIVWGKELTLLYNDPFSKIIKEKHPSAIGKPTREVWPDSWSIMQQDFDQVMLQHETIFLSSQKVSLRFQDSLVSHLPLSMYEFPICIENGQVGGVNITLINLTEGTRKEDTILESERIYRAIGESLDYGIWICDPKGQNIYASESFLKLVGLTQEQCSKLGWGNVLHPDDVERTLSAWKKCVLTGEKWNMEHRFRGIDGEWHPVLARGIAVKNERGEITAWAGINLDISELKQAEEQLQQASERLSLATHAAKVGIWDWDLRTNRLVWNDQMYELYGISSSQFSGAYEAWENSVYPDDLPSALEDLKKATSGESDFNSEFRVIWPDNSIHHIQALGLLKKDKSGHPVRMTGTNWDMTERKKLENDLRAAIELRDEFMSIASHELKTPLTALSMQIQLLMQTSSVEAANILSRKAYKATQSLISLVNDLLDVTRIRAGKLVIETQEMDLRSAIYKILSLIKEEAASKGLSFTLKADRPVIGKWDPKRIDQILSNLLSNGIKYGEGKPIEISLTADYHLNRARISVKDNGMGISKEIQPKIFERFQRAVSGSSISGLGLGLYITRQIIEAHAGSIRVESELGKGSTFLVELPLDLERSPLNTGNTGDTGKHPLSDANSPLQKPISRDSS